MNYYPAGLNVFSFADFKVETFRDNVVKTANNYGSGNFKYYVIKLEINRLYKFYADVEPIQIYERNTFKTLMVVRPKESEWVYCGEDKKVGLYYLMTVKSKHELIDLELKSLGNITDTS